MQNIRYEKNVSLELDQFIELNQSSTLAERRPADDREVMRQMMDNADLTITAWDGDALVGISRTLTDFAFVAYLPDLAVSQSHQRRGVGKRLIQEAQAALGHSAWWFCCQHPMPMSSILTSVLLTIRRRGFVPETGQRIPFEAELE